ncbi:hypothetical protein SESBI_28985 [Sesbania bispinosa]|nr:hypothetical protein SESBI_28985 [Sesbania bispinosa]
MTFRKMERGRRSCRVWKRRKGGRSCHGHRHSNGARLLGSSGTVSALVVLRGEEG